MSRKKWLTVLIIAAVLAGEAAFLMSRRSSEVMPGAAPGSVGLITTIVDVQGEVEAAPQERDEWRALRPGDALREGERLRTGPDGRVEVDLQERCRVVLGSAGYLRMTTLDDPDTGASVGIRLDLDRGAALVTVRQLQRKDRFHIVTPTAVCGVRGTRFLVSVESGEGAP